MPRSIPSRFRRRWRALIVVAVALTMTACSNVTNGATDDLTGPAPVIRTGLGIDEVAYLGDDKAWLPGGIDDVDVDAVAGTLTYVYFDEAGDPSREVVICTATERVRAARLWNTSENDAHATPSGVSLASSEADVEAILGIPFADGFDSSTGWWVNSYEGPFASTGISFAYRDGDRSSMVRIEVYGPFCP